MRVERSSGVLISAKPRTSICLCKWAEVQKCLSAKRQYKTSMTVKEIFELRKEGRVEEAYNAILPMYRVHHGKYTSLAMFLFAVDMMNLLLGKVKDNTPESLAALAEAEKIYMSLQRLAPKLYDESGACAKAVENLGVALSAAKRS